MSVLAFNGGNHYQHKTKAKYLNQELKTNQKCLPQYFNMRKFNFSFRSKSLSPWYCDPLCLDELIWIDLLYTEVLSFFVAKLFFSLLFLFRKSCPFLNSFFLGNQMNLGHLVRKSGQVNLTQRQITKFFKLIYP